VQLANMFTSNHKQSA